MIKWRGKEINTNKWHEGYYAEYGHLFVYETDEDGVRVSDIDVYHNTVHPADFATELEDTLDNRIRCLIMMEQCAEFMRHKDECYYYVQRWVQKELHDLYKEHPDHPMLGNYSSKIKQED